MEKALDIVAHFARFGTKRLTQATAIDQTIKPLNNSELIDVPVMIERFSAASIAPVCRKRLSHERCGLPDLGPFRKYRLARFESGVRTKADILQSYLHCPRCCRLRE